MELGKPSRYLKCSFFLIGALITCNIELLKSADFQQFFRDEKKTEIDFDNIFFEYTIPFEYYDSYSNQFDDFFGMNYLETDDKRNFQDLSISIDSKKIRDLYKDMLEGITTIKKVNIDKEPHYKKKI